MATVLEVIKASPLPLLETHLLLQHVLGVNRAWLIAHDGDTLDSTKLSDYSSLQQRRINGEPIAYIVGIKEFYGREFNVNPDVLIPRPDTELLVQTALEFIEHKEQPKVLDLGTGSGAIAISIALEHFGAKVYAVDNSQAALVVAKENAQSLGARVKFYAGNWYDTGLDNKLLHNYFDLIVANPPYVSEFDDHLEQGDLRFEPSQALTDFAGGLSAIMQVVKGASGHLAKGGALFVEHGWDQAASVREIFIRSGFSKVQSKLDLSGIERITCGFL